MNNGIKQISTGKVELCLVQISEECTKHHIGINPNGTRLFLWDGKGLCTHLPSGNWQIVGISDQLSEEQAREAVPSIEGAHGNSYFHYTCTLPNGSYGYVSTAKESFASLMQANECFSENPYEKPMFMYEFGGEGPTESQLASAEHDYDERVQQWNEYEVNTGTWLVLKRL